MLYYFISEFIYNIIAFKININSYIIKLSLIHFKLVFRKIIYLYLIIKKKLNYSYLNIRFVKSTIAKYKLKKSILHFLKMFV